MNASSKTNFGEEKKIWYNYVYVLLYNKLTPNSEAENDNHFTYLLPIRLLRQGSVGTAHLFHMPSAWGSSARAGASTSNMASLIWLAN